MLKPLLISSHRSHRLVQGHNLGAVLDQHLVPGVHHGGLVQEHLLHVLQLEAPLVDVLLQLSVQYTQVIIRGGREETLKACLKVIVEAAGAAAVVVVLLVRLA